MLLFVYLFWYFGIFLLRYFGFYRDDLCWIINKPVGDLQCRLRIILFACLFLIHFDSSSWLQQKLLFLSCPPVPPCRSLSQGHE